VDGDEQINDAQLICAWSTVYHISTKSIVDDDFDVAVMNEAARCDCLVAISLDFLYL
jgi:hypothetical protein